MSQDFFLHQHKLLALDHHAIVSATDDTGRIIHVNDRFCEISGFPREELIGASHSIVKSGLHSPSMYKELWRTITRGEIWHGELCNRRKDGSLYWVESTIAPIADHQGVIRQFISIRTDISHLKITAAALRRQGELQHLLTEATTLLLNTTPDRTDPAIKQVLRRSAEHLRADHAYLFLYSEDRQQMSITHEWCAPGIRPGRSKLRNIAVTAAPWWTRQASQRGFIIVSDVAELPPAAGSEQALFKSLQVRSLFAHPLQQDGTTIGFIGFSAIRETRDWRLEDVHPFTVLADALASTLIRHRMERALILREQQLRQAQAIARMGSWEANIATGKVIWSDETFRILGHSPGSCEPTLEIFRAAIHPDDVAKFAAAEKLAWRSGHFDSISSIVRPDGTIRHVHIIAKTESNGLGNPVRHAGTIHDITERIDAETRLRESEQRFSFAVEGAGDGIWDWNPQTLELSVSDHYGIMLGYEPGELTKNPPVLDTAVHPEDLPLVKQATEDYLSGRTASYTIEIRLRCKHGGYKWILARATAVAWDQDGKVTRVIGINSDISNHKAVEQSLILAREEAVRANRAKSEFLSSMSHELRTPMNAILGFGQLLETDHTLDAEQQDNVHEILKAGHHLLELINEVLDLAKVESGRIDLSLEALDLRPVAEECLNLVSPLANSHNVHVTYQVPDDSLVRADRTRLKQALINLLSNAIKYNRPGGEVRLDIQLVAQDRLRLRVSDTGPGIPGERMHELFQPFNRLGAEHSEVEGTGIGLTITERIVEIMGGRVGADSQVGVGSTFWIELPRETTQAGAGLSGQLLGMTDSVGKLPRTQHVVLYIEDNPANLKLVAQMLGRRKHITLLTAHQPGLGIELALAHHPELILLDINMPGMNGYQALEVLKADARLRLIPAVAITANAMPQDVIRGMAAGFSDYLTKPLAMTRLFTILDRFLLTKEDNHEPGLHRQ